MPAVVSHYLLAERIYNVLLEFQPQLALDHTAFIWGASGPDIFFLHRVMPYQKGRSLKEYGSKIHSMNASKIVNEALLEAKRQEDRKNELQEEISSLKRKLRNIIDEQEELISNID